MGKTKVFADGVEMMAVYIDLQRVLGVSKLKNNRLYNVVG
jgi:hypothetical protein